MAVVISQLSDQQLNMLLADLENAGIIIAEDNSREKHKYNTVNVFLFPDITGFSDGYNSLITELEGQNVTFYRLISPLLEPCKKVFQNHGVELPKTMEEIVGLYRILLKKKELTPDVYVGWSWGGAAAIEAGIQTLRNHYPTYVVVLDTVSPSIRLPHIETNKTWKLFDTLLSQLRQNTPVAPIKNLALQDIVDYKSFSEGKSSQEQAMFAYKKLSVYFTSILSNDFLNTKEIGSIHRFLHQIKNVCVHKAILDNYNPNANPRISDLYGTTFVFSEETIKDYAAVYSKDDRYLGWKVSRDNTNGLSPLANQTYTAGKQTHFTMMNPENDSLVSEVLATTIAAVTPLKSALEVAADLMLRSRKRINRFERRASSDASSEASSSGDEYSSGEISPPSSSPEPMSYLLKPPTPSVTPTLSVK